MNPPLGVYGTLLDAEVRRLVLGRCRTRAGVLAGWERVYVAGEIYPGIRPRAGARTDLLVLDGLDAPALARGDAFEGEEYERQVLQFTFADGEPGEAMVYVPTPAIRLSDRPWRYDWLWRARHRRRFLAMTRATMTRAAMMGGHTVVRG
ncbi:MAG: gamma-glutamylcyclotransferase [Alphaproteobacteria bacterium]|nr:gamma-glutamylcyclotransferase [Alphaproteobacteria bacterium]MCB9928375.1 gamma-glutamylcyclotransferase [Alphaproteobacteria bacterium]